jgi:hypothetical protein
MKLKVKVSIKFPLKSCTKVFQLKLNVTKTNYHPSLIVLVAIIPDNVKREVLQEISRFLESNLS